MSTSPYSLCHGQQNSDLFYRQLRTLSKETYSSLYDVLETDLKEYGEFVTERGELFRSHEEYSIELLTLAMTWKEYLGPAQQTSPTLVSLLKRLYYVRATNRILKKPVDHLRGVLTGLFIYPNLDKGPKENRYTLANLKRLLRWLDATGEFADEVKRFKNWYDLITIKGEEYLQSLMIQTMQELEKFQDRAQQTLGSTTCGVAGFHKRLPQGDRWREDALFRRKSPLVYHINMLASEIMNWGLSKKFLATSKRVILAPACMSKADGKNCERKKVGQDILCNECTDSCNISQLTKVCRENDLELVIVPHSGAFTRWLKRWENTTEKGIIALACPLNIVVGGYQMRELNIPSQCVLLDYSGCTKHWGPQFNATEVNISRLLKVAKEGA